MPSCALRMQLIQPGNTCVKKFLFWTEKRYLRTNVLSKAKVGVHLATAILLIVQPWTVPSSKSSFYCALTVFICVKVTFNKNSLSAQFTSVRSSFRYWLQTYHNVIQERNRKTIRASLAWFVRLCFLRFGSHQHIWIYLSDSFKWRLLRHSYQTLTEGARPMLSFLPA